MAYAIVASKWLEDKRYIEAVLDSAADLAALGDGYAPDSRAIVAEGGAAYMTDASGQWQELGSPGGGGGSSVTVEPLTVTQNGTTTAPSGKAYSPVTVNVPNPNYVETISGTLANPFGSHTASDLFASADANLLTMKMDITTSAYNNRTLWYCGTLNSNYCFGVGGVASDYPTNDSYVFIGAVYTPAGVYTGLIVAANDSGDEYGNIILDKSRDGVPTTLTIIHHPLPSA